jgi:hypothetical protein
VAAFGAAPVQPRTFCDWSGDLKSGMSGNGIKVPVLVQDGHSCSERRNCDQAIGERSDGITLPPTGAVESGRSFVVREPLQRQWLAPVQEPPQASKVGFVTSTCEHFHDNYIRRRQRRLTSQKIVNPHVGRGAGRAEERHPGGGIDENHGMRD